MSTYDFSAFYSTLPHNPIKEKLTEIAELTFYRGGSLNLACYSKRVFSFLKNLKCIICGHVRKVGPLSIDFLNFGSELQRQIVDIPMGASCAPLVAVFFVMRQASCFLYLTIIKLMLSII